MHATSRAGAARAKDTPGAGGLCIRPRRCCAQHPPPRVRPWRSPRQTGMPQEGALRRAAGRTRALSRCPGVAAARAKAVLPRRRIRALVGPWGWRPLCRASAALPCCPASTGLVSVPKKKQRPRTLENQRKAVSHCGTARCSDRGALLRRDGGGRGSAGGLDVPQGPRHQLYVLLSRGDGRVAMGKAPAGRRAQARGAVGRADAGAAGAFARAPPPQRIAHAQAFARPARPRERARAPRCATPPARFRA